MQRTRVLVISDDAFRCQIAASLLREQAGGSFDVVAAAMAPTPLADETIEVMRETGIDLREPYVESVEEFADQLFDWVITLSGATDEAFPVIAGAEHYIHWFIENPAELDGLDTRSAFRKVRDDMARRLKVFAAEHGSRLSYAVSTR